MPQAQIQPSNASCRIRGSICPKGLPVLTTGMCPFSRSSRMASTAESGMIWVALSTMVPSMSKKTTILSSALFLPARRVPCGLPPSSYHARDFLSMRRRGGFGFLLVFWQIWAMIFQLICTIMLDNPKMQRYNRMRYGVRCPGIWGSQRFMITGVMPG